MAPRRALGVSGFDIVVQHGAGAYQLWKIIHKDREKFQGSRSLYIQISEDGFDETDDDQWAMALEGIRPGNVQHNLKSVKIEVTGQAWFSAYSTAVLSPSSTNNLYRQAQTPFMGSRSAFTRLTEPAVATSSERAFIKALFNLRDIEKVEIVGPMQAELKKQLAVAMTTRRGHKVREWRYGGGLRSNDDISLGTWSAAMPAGDEGGEDAGSAYELNPFYDQSLFPRQPMQIVTYANFEANRRASLTKVGRVEEMIRPKLPLDCKLSPSSPAVDTETAYPGGKGRDSTVGYARVGGPPPTRKSSAGDSAGKCAQLQKDDRGEGGSTERTRDQSEEVDEDSMAVDWLDEAMASDDSKDRDYEE